jgi:hypothetical protein
MLVQLVCCVGADPGLADTTFAEKHAKGLWRNGHHLSLKPHLVILPIWKVNSNDIYLTLYLTTISNSTSWKKVQGRLERQYGCYYGTPSDQEDFQNNWEQLFPPWGSFHMINTSSYDLVDELL